MCDRIFSSPQKRSQLRPTCSSTRFRIPGSALLGRVLPPRSPATRWSSHQWARTAPSCGPFSCPFPLTRTLKPPICSPACSTASTSTPSEAILRASRLLEKTPPVGGAVIFIFFLNFKAQIIFLKNHQITKHILTFSHGLCLLFPCRT